MNKKSIKILIYPILSSALVILTGVYLGKYLLLSGLTKLFYSIILTNIALVTPLIFTKSRIVFLSGIKGFKNINKLTLISKTIAYYILFNILTVLLTIILKKIGFLTNIFQEQVGIINLLKQFEDYKIILIIFIGLLGPTLEELYFRNFIMEFLKKVFNFKIAILAQALLFGLLHGEIQSLGFVVIWGLYLGVIREKHNIYYSIALHSLVNTVSFIFLF